MNYLIAKVKEITVADFYVTVQLNVSHDGKGCTQNKYIAKSGCQHLAPMIQQHHG